MLKMLSKATFFILLVALISCSGTKKEEQTVQLDRNGDWLYLFNGNTDGWRSFNGETLPEGWVVEDNILKALGTGGDIGGDIVFAGREFENFDLQWEWKIVEGGNSGLFYHVVEGDQYDAPYQNAPEYQLIDDIGYPAKLEPWQSVGADYAMYDPNPDKFVKASGKWNLSRIRFTPEKVEYWLNAVKTLEFVPWSDDWNQRKMAGKWKDYPDYGKAKSGFIGLQDHGGMTWFRNIKIKPL